MLGVEFVTGLASPVFVSYHHSIADHHPLESDLGSPHLVGIDEGTGKIGNIHPTIGLSSDPEVVAH